MATTMRPRPPNAVPPRSSAAGSRGHRPWWLRIRCRLWALLPNVGCVNSTGPPCSGSRDRRARREPRTTSRPSCPAVGSTVATSGNYNNEIGVPLTVLRADETTDYLIVEMGARARGDIAYLCTVAHPTIGAVLNVGTAHLGEFGSQQAIAAAKGELVESLPTNRLRRAQCRRSLGAGDGGPHAGSRRHLRRGGRRVCTIDHLRRVRPPILRTRLRGVWQHRHPGRHRAAPGDQRVRCRSDGLRLGVGSSAGFGCPQ